MTLGAEPGRGEPRQTGMAILRAVGVTLLFLIMTACGNQVGRLGPSVTAPAARDASYVVTGITRAGQARPLVNGSQLRLDFANGRLTVTAGCNTMSGAYRQHGNRITVSSLATTEMGCSPALMKQDIWVAGLFAHPVTLAFGKNATLTSGEVVLMLADRRTVSPDRPLVGTKWLFDTVYAGATAGSVPRGDVAWVEFNRNGTVYVNDGLNDGSGKVTVSRDRIVFGDMAWTLVGCASRCTVGNFSAVFSGTTTFSITEDRLTLTHGADGLGFHAVEKFPPRS